MVAIMWLATAPAQARVPSKAASPTQEAAAAELMGIVGDGFRIKQTDHFTIAYNTPYDTLRSLVGRLEGTHMAVVRFCEGNGRRVEPLDVPLRVIFHDDYEDYEAYCRKAGVDAASTAGFYEHDTNLAVFCNTRSQPSLSRLNRQIDDAAARLKKRGKSLSNPARRQLVRQLNVWRAHRDAAVEMLNRLVIQHEAAHQILFNIGVHARRGQNPGWLTEGIACQFEVPQARAAHGIGRVNHYRLADFRDALKLPNRSRSVTDAQVRTAIDATQLVASREFVSDRQLFARRDGHLPFRYAQAWALVFYLRREKPDAFAAYVAHVSERAATKRLDEAAVLAEFETYFGAADAAFDRRWIAYVVKLAFEPREAGR